MLQRWTGAPLAAPPDEPLAPPASPLERWKLPATTILIVVGLLGAALWLVRRPLDQPVALPTIAPGVAAPRELKVHVVGAVVRPGVLALADGARVADAIDAAGGPAEGADLARLNLAERLRDGRQVVVPGSGEAARAAEPSAATPRASAPKPIGPVNLNRASQAELEALPGIGAATAGRIVRHRDQNGPFASIEQFRRARLVSAATWGRIERLVELP